jgi:cytoskeletal protein CcmA (bactofilin family)
VSAPQDSERKHLDEMTCLLYLERQLERARAMEASAHTQECAACRTLLHALERESRLLTRAMLEEEEPLPVRLAGFQAKVRQSMEWIWMLAFGLAATGVYALYTGYIEPWQQRLEQAGFGGTNLLGLLIFQGAFWKGWQSMISLIEVLAVGTLLGSAVLVLRRRLRRGTVMALVLAGLCAALALPAPASATEFRKGESANVPKDETIQGDVLLSGDRMRVEGTVDGDVFAFGRSLEVPGHVKGDVIVFAQSARVSGQVDGNIRGFNNNLTVTGTIGRSITEFCESLTIETSGKAGGSLTVFANNITMDGQVGRDILSVADRVNVTGTIGGGIHARGASMEIGSTANIGGPVRFEGKSAPTVEQGAKLASPVQFTKLERKHREFGGGSIFWQVILLAAFVLYALVLINLAPQFAREAVQSAENIGASLGLGILVFFGVLIGAIIASITVVGLFIGISTFFVWMIAVYAAQPVVGALIGQWLMGRTSEIWPLIGRMAVGLVIIRAVEMVPYGGWIKFGVVLWGLGAISIALYKRFQPPARAAMMPAGPTPPLPAMTTVGGGSAV